MVWIGIDDTDIVGSPGTNQMARAIVAALSDGYVCQYILRHQLLDDPRVPYTSKNGSASIELVSRSNVPCRLEEIAAVAAICETVMKDRFVEGSDPGLCVVRRAPKSIQEFGRRCQRELVGLRDAEALAAQEGVFLKGLGGTCGGIIGALAAVGLAATRDDGRVVVLGTWPEVSGMVSVEQLNAQGIAVMNAATMKAVTTGTIDLVKKLRPNIRQGQVVLQVRSAPEGHAADWIAIKV